MHVTSLPCHVAPCLAPPSRNNSGYSSSLCSNPAKLKRPFQWTFRRLLMIEMLWRGQPNQPQTNHRTTGRYRPSNLRLSSSATIRASGVIVACINRLKPSRWPVPSLVVTTESGIPQAAKTSRLASSACSISGAPGAAPRRRDSQSPLGPLLRRRRRPSRSKLVLSTERDLAPKRPEYRPSKPRPSDHFRQLARGARIPLGPDTSSAQGLASVSADRPASYRSTTPAARRHATVVRDRPGAGRGSWRSLGTGSKRRQPTDGPPSVRRVAPGRRIVNRR